MTRLIPALIIGALLLIPLGLLPFRSDEVNTFIREMENRNPHAFPSFQSLTQLTNQKKYNELGSFLSDRYPLRDFAIPGLAKFNYEILKKPHINGVDRGRDGDWLFLHSSLNLGYQDPAAALVAMDELQTFIEAFAAAPNDDLAKVTLVIVPDKASIYTEELSDYSLREYERFLPARERLQEIFTQTEGINTIDIWALYRQMKSESSDLFYHRYDTHHTQSAGLNLVKTIVNEMSDPEAWPAAAYSLKNDFYYRTKADLAGKAGLWSARERLQVKSVPVRNSEIRIATKGDGNEIQLTSYKDWATWTGETVRTRAKPNGDPLVTGKVLLVHDSFIGSYRSFLAPYFEDITFTHFAKFPICAIDDAIREYDQVIIEVVERSAARPNIIKALLRPCSALHATDLELSKVQDTEVHGGVGRCKVEENSSWYMAGWVLVGSPPHKPEELLVVNRETGNIVPTQTIWRQRPDIRRSSTLGPARFEDVGFWIKGPLLPEHFDILALANGELYRLRTVGKQCQEELDQARAPAQP